MVEVFRTNVCEPSQVSGLVEKLLSVYPSGSVTFDLEDCDNVLRIEHSDICARSVISLMEASGFSCEILS